MQTLKEKLDQQKLERLNQKSLQKEEAKKPPPTYFPFGKKSPEKKQNVALEATDEPDHEELMIKELTDPSKNYNIPRQEKVFFQILKRDSKEVPVLS